MKTGISVKISLLIAIILSSVVHAADKQSAKVTEWVKGSSGNAVASIAGAGALYAIKADQLSILEKVSPGLKRTQALAQEADGKAKNAYTQASKFKDSFSTVYNHESSARLSEYETLMYKGDYWRTEQRKYSALFDREVEAAVKKLKSMPDQGLYRQYRMKGTYSKVIRPIGGVVLLLEAVHSVGTFVGSKEIKAGQSIALKESSAAKSLRKPAASDRGDLMPVVETDQNSSQAEAAK